MASREETGDNKNDDEEAAVKFTECGFCGVSSEGNGDGDFDFESAFAMSSGSFKVSGREHKPCNACTRSYLPPHTHVDCSNM